MNSTLLHLHFVFDSTLSLICMEVDSFYHYNTETILSLKETTAKQTGFNKKKKNSICVSCKQFGSESALSGALWIRYIIPLPSICKGHVWSGNIRCVPKIKYSNSRHTFACDQLDTALPYRSFADGSIIIDHFSYITYNLSVIQNNVI